ncbi:MAG: TatD family hydrolase [Kiritimatiellia bacterium]|jgi:TatD DNase family protein|nr:TatD family hydrolase [Kiritimatiellia bacterium]MDP6811154.1 TatD family hydrolase [Kiritimatiellia bacterium]MDP7025289.1 TatD family hydrolase [Kiritimatiellia bacterium]
MFVDTHMHLEPGDDVAGLSSRAIGAGVQHMVAVGGSDTMNSAALAAASEQPKLFSATVAFDRHVAETGGAGDVPALVERVRAMLDAPGVVAVGEIGLDYHYSPETANEQQALLGGQLELARERGLPVVVHSREAEADTLSMLRAQRRAWQHEYERLGVLHCFTGNADMAKELVAIGLFISFSGIVTFRNADSLREAAAVVPDEWLLIETDTPYLAPVPHRGKPNEPAYLSEVAKCLADVRGVSVEQIAEVTTANAKRLFHIHG